MNDMDVIQAFERLIVIDELITNYSNRITELKEEREELSMEIVKNIEINKKIIAKLHRHTTNQKKDFL